MQTRSGGPPGTRAHDVCMQRCRQGAVRRCRVQISLGNPEAWINSRSRAYRGHDRSRTGVNPPTPRLPPWLHHMSIRHTRLARPLRPLLALRPISTLRPVPRPAPLSRLPALPPLLHTCAMTTSTPDAAKGPKVHVALVQLPAAMPGGKAPQVARMREMVRDAVKQGRDAGEPVDIVVLGVSDQLGSADGRKCGTASLCVFAGRADGRATTSWCRTPSRSPPSARPRPRGPRTRPPAAPWRRRRARAPSGCSAGASPRPRTGGCTTARRCGAPPARSSRRTARRTSSTCASPR
jgi:hypothetical protein